MTLELSAGHLVYEIKIPGFDKGGAIERFMNREPFAGRMPIFVADDAVDQPGVDKVPRSAASLTPSAADCSVFPGVREAQGRAGMARKVGSMSTPNPGGRFAAAAARSRAHRQLPRRGARRFERPVRLVVLSPLRFQSRLQPAAQRRRGKGLLRCDPGGPRPRQFAYVHNTAIVETELEDKQGARVRITDFAPRFMRYERMFHPPQLVRRIVPLRGLPRITIRVRPTEDYGRAISDWTAGSNHIRYHSGGTVMRLSTDAPLSYITQETTFTLSRPLTLFLGPDEPFRSALEGTGQEFEEQTRRLLARLGALARDTVRMAGRGDPRGDHSQTLQFRGDRRHRRRAYDLHPRGGPTAVGIGTIDTAGSATPISSSRRSTRWAPRRRWRPISTTS